MTEPTKSSVLSRYWIVLGGLLIALGYLPMLQAPFDFTDDGNLVYGAPSGTTPTGYVTLWWDKVVANVVHLGPFRPVLWVHWEVMANCFQDSPFIWRGAKLLWCAFAASTLLWLLKELGIPPLAAFLACASAVLNPYRNEIFTSLTLAEGVAMPYAMLALLAARKASLTDRHWRWDILSIISWLFTLGCKNSFVALLPAVLFLRCWSEGVSLRVRVWQLRWVVMCYFLPMVLPVGHFIYFKLNWKAGQYETPGPSFAQFKQIALWMKGAAGFDFLGVGLAGVILVQVRSLRELFSAHRLAILTALVLLVCGVLIYLPLNIMAPRYTMPAIWGFDIVVAVLLTGLLNKPRTAYTRIAWFLFGVGLVVLMIANIGRQERLIARHRMLWDALIYVEQTTPTGTSIEWISGETGSHALNIEEGIHFAWHLQARGRGDVSVGLLNQSGEPMKRVELPPLTHEANLRMTMTPGDPAPSWQTEQRFSRSYRFGRQQYACQLQQRVLPTNPAP